MKIEKNCTTKKIITIYICECCERMRVRVRVRMRVRVRVGAHARV